MPILQLKLLISAISHKKPHTVGVYSLKKDEPKLVEYRIQDNKERTASSNEPKFPVTVVALIFLKKGFL